MTAVNVKVRIQPRKVLIIIQIPPDSCISWDCKCYQLSPAIYDLWETLPWNALLTWHVQYCMICVPLDIAIEFKAELEPKERALLYPAIKRSTRDGNCRGRPAEGNPQEAMI